MKTYGLALGLIALAIGGVVLAGSAGDGDISDAPLPDTVSYHADIAPLVARECLDCHGDRPIAPFSLRTFDEVRDRAERIVRATTTRQMPPWLPAGDPGRFAGERVLTEREVALFEAWVEDGMVEGDPADAPEVRAEPAWDPGEPDLLVPLPVYDLPAEGSDSYRNLVVRIPVEETRWVEYVDLRPGNRTAVHHARMMVDTTDSSRRLDETDPGPGFDGMEMMSNASNPDGHFIGWTPGKSKLPPLEGMAWRLDPGTDLVVQLHLRTSGEPQQVAAEVEFHFADEPPSLHPAVLVVSSLQIDIPPGATDYTVSNSFTLPVPVEVLSVYPHAHFLGKDLRATAILPNGREQTLIHIPDWDFNWQDDYRFAKPISLPAGTTILKEFTFDNSAENPRNPSDPPRRVVYGSNSDDEMADLILQVLPRNEDERAELLQAQAWQHEAEDMAYMAELEFGRGRDAAGQGELDRATRHFQEALQYRSDHVGSLMALADIFLRRGDTSSAVVIARQSVTVTGRQNAEALAVFAVALARAGSEGEARAAAREARALARASGDQALVGRVDSRLGAIGR